MTFQELKSKYGLRLNGQQERAVCTIDGPVLLLAVPGSGKTTTLVSRIGNMIYGRGIDPQRILTMTYTVAAAQDMRQRFVSIFGNSLSDQLEFRTINGVCAKIIREYETRYDRTAFALVSPDAQAEIVSDIYRQQTRQFASENIVQAVLLQICYAKNNMTPKAEREQIKLDGKIAFEPIYAAYNRLLVDNKWMDYDDQLRYAWRLLRQYPDILDAFQTRFPYICVDEAQDTSKIQHYIIRMLAGKTRNLFLVGDEDQSIYGFRAAYPAALMEFDRVYPDAKVLLLEQNYRSTPQITAVADLFIRANKKRHKKTIRPTRRSGLPVGAMQAQDRQDQYDQLVSLARTCRSQTAILYRNNHSAIPLIDQLDREGIPFRCRGMDSLFFTSPVVQDIMDFMAFAVNPLDCDVFERIYYKLGAGISKEKMQFAAAESRVAGEPPLKILAADNDLSKYVRSVCQNRLYDFRYMSRMRADTAIAYAVEEWYGAYCKERKAGMDKIETLKLLGRFQQTPAHLLDRMGELNDLIRQGTMDADSPLILSTIHSSKGLEYDRVILIDVIDGVFPQKVPGGREAMNREDWEALEEDRRLFYVGMTRAKDELLLVRFTPQDGAAELTSQFCSRVFGLQQMLRNTADK